MGGHIGPRPEGNNPYIPDVTTDPYFSSVSLLLHGNGINGTQNKTFLDSSTNNFTVTRFGNTTQGTFNPFVSSPPYSPNVNGGSMYFDGNGDYLQTPTSSALAANSTNYTVEAWAYLDLSTYSGFDFAGRGIVSDFGANANGRWLFTINSGGFLAFAEQDAAGSNDVAVTDSVVFPLRTWTHVMAVKSGTTMYLFKNGVLVNTATSSSRTTFVGRINIGQATVDTNYRGYFIGYISNVRFLKDTALYTTNFTPPTAPLTAITNTSLLLSGTNAGIFDNAMKNNLETVGNAQISTLVKKYGTGSMYFDGGGTGAPSYLALPATSTNALSGNLFTIEGWFYPTDYGKAGYSAPGAVMLLSTTSTSSSSGGNFGFQLFLDGTVGVSLTSLGIYANNGTLYQVYNYTFSLNQWYYIAVVRDTGGAFRIYINGILIGSFTNASTWIDNSPYTIARSNQASYERPFTGYIDDFRITQGVARYTSDFIPPTAAFPNS